MKIDKLKELDVGISGVKVSGDITYVKLPKNWEGKDKKTGRAYNFWSQFVVLEDSSGSIGCNLTFPKETDALEEGVTNITIRGKVDEYRDNNGELQKSLSNGRIIRIKEEEKGVTGGKTNNKENEMHIVRECSIKTATELVCAKVIKFEDLFPYTEKIASYIYGGLEKEETKAEEKGPEEEVPPEDMPGNMTSDVPF